MDQQGSTTGGEPNRGPVERNGDRELVITRLFTAPRHTVYEAWSQPELFRRWWMPGSASGVSLVSCDMDVCTGGTYRLGFGAGGSDIMVFHGKYLEVVPEALEEALQGSATALPKQLEQLDELLSGMAG